jgi:hypothetical protein
MDEFVSFLGGGDESGWWKRPDWGEAPRAAKLDKGERDCCSSGREKEADGGRCGDWGCRFRSSSSCCWEASAASDWATPGSVAAGEVGEGEREAEPRAREEAGGSTGRDAGAGGRAEEETASRAGAGAEPGAVGAEAGIGDGAGARDDEEGEVGASARLCTEFMASGDARADEEREGAFRAWEERAAKVRESQQAPCWSSTLGEEGQAEVPVCWKEEIWGRDKPVDRKKKQSKKRKLHSTKLGKKKKEGRKGGGGGGGGRGGREVKQDETRLAKGITVRGR